MVQQELQHFTCEYPLLRDGLLELFAKADLAAKLADGSVVSEQEVGVIVVEHDRVAAR